MVKCSYCFSSEPEAIKNVDGDDQQENATTTADKSDTESQIMSNKSSVSSNEESDISNGKNNTAESIEDTDDNLDDSIKNNTPNKAALKAEDLKITPKKVLSPKQLAKKLESEKKRQEKVLEREEKKRQKMEEKEKILEEKKKVIEEKKKVIEEKMRLKQEKEEQRLKEKLAKQEEKDKKRREKEEKDELKKKEIEEKNKEKQKLEEQKQKTKAAFANFFVTKKSGDNNEDKKVEGSSKFMPFEVKSDMRLAPVNRWALSEDDKLKFDETFQKQESGCKLYLDELKTGEKQVGKSCRTWSPTETEQDDDVVIVETNVGESIEEPKPKLEKMRAKFLKFHENQRPPYFGTWNKKSKTVTPRKPFGRDDICNYEVDSDEEWEEEGEGESLKGTDDEDEKENESENEYEVDNEVFVPHAYLSEDEMNDEENARLSPSAHKAKLKLLKCEFDEEMKFKTQKLKPRVIGCVWYDKNKNNVEEAIDRYLQPFAMICNGRIKIKKRSEIAHAATKKSKKLLEKEHVPMFLKFIHGSVDKRKNILKDFVEHMEEKGVRSSASQNGLGRQLKTLAQWKKCPDEGSMHNKMCWYVNEDVRKEYNVILTVPEQPQKMNRKKTK